MIAALLAQKLRRQRTLLVVLALALTGFPVLLLWIGTTIDRGPGVGELLAKMPKWIQRLVEQQIGEVSFRAFPAFAFEHPVVLLASLSQVLSAATTPASERESGFLDLQVAQRLRRGEYFAATALLVVLGAVAWPGCLLLGVAIGFRSLDLPQPLSVSTYLPGCLGLATLLLAFGGVGLWFGCAQKRRGRALAQLIGCIAAAYLLHVLGTLSSRLAVVEWLSPFHWFQPLRVILKGEPMVGSSAVLLGVFASCTAAAWRSFDRQDL
ncbi:MAG: hypothetical protein KDC87_10230 [Planctomycetes bacterium]|nr:hypothetical protein [Planctomycetota bacterium]MCB9871108.1 hypothetical protein [Planctomycetota bacterium]MCB9888254.1 hypothetical protein [Planctomycetota bacterium]